MEMSTFTTNGKCYGQWPIGFRPIGTFWLSRIARALKSILQPKRAGSRQKWRSMQPQKVKIYPSDCVFRKKSLKESDSRTTLSDDRTSLEIQLNTTSQE